MAKLHTIFFTLITSLVAQNICCMLAPLEALAQKFPREKDNCTLIKACILGDLESAIVTCNRIEKLNDCVADCAIQGVFLCLPKKSYESLEIMKLMLLKFPYVRTAFPLCMKKIYTNRKPEDELLNNLNELLDFAQDPIIRIQYILTKDYYCERTTNKQEKHCVLM